MYANLKSTGCTYYFGCMKYFLIFFLLNMQLINLKPNYKRLLL